MTRQALKIAPTPSALDTLAAACAVAKIESERAYQATQSQSERQRLAPIIATLKNALAAYHEDAPGSRRASHTDAGEPLADLLRDLFEAMPTPSTQKLSKPWGRLLAFYHQPRFRFLEDANPGALLTDCETGRTVYFQPGDDADRARKDFNMCDSAAPLTEAGCGVANPWVATASEYFA